MRLHKTIAAACAVLLLLAPAGCGKARPETPAGSAVPSGGPASSGFAPPASSAAGGTSPVDSSLSPQSAGTAASSSPSASRPAVSSAAKTDAARYPLTITDDVGRKFTIKAKPKKLACISVTYLNALYQIGGTAYIRTDASAGGAIPQGAKNVFSVGNTVTVNMELLIAKQPDLVICQKGLHDTVAAQLLAAGIPAVELSMEGFDDVVHDVRLLGKIADRQSAAEDLIGSMKARVQAIVSKAPKDPIEAVILYVTSTDVSVKLDNSIAGDVAKRLGVRNIAAGLKPVAAGSDYAPFSLETIVAADPDVILVSTMVSATADAQKRISAELGNNPAWNGLTAVRQNKIYFLPQSYFLYNPGLGYDVAVQYMASLVYPEVFGGVG